MALDLTGGMSGDDDAEVHTELFKGSYDFYNKEDLYSEETFTISINEKGTAYIYKSEAMTRLQTGEFMQINVLKYINNDWITLSAKVAKTLGHRSVTEIFTYNAKKGAVDYEFITEDRRDEMEISVPPKFHIATYDTASSMTFLSSKKYDATGTNYYNILSTPNFWEFKEKPKVNFLILEKQGNTPEAMTVRKRKVKGLKYFIYQKDPKLSKNQDVPMVLISNHRSIPYIVSHGEDTLILIRNLNNLEVERESRI